MAKFIREASVVSDEPDKGVSVKSLVTPESVSSDNVLTEQITLTDRAKFNFAVGDNDICWVHMLDGSCDVSIGGTESSLGEEHFLFLAPRENIQFECKETAHIFRATVPEAGRFDPSWTNLSLASRLTDWTNEPVLNSEFDARKRIYMITPQLSGTKAVKGEMIIYPPGTEASNHHHEGAEHFMVVLDGSATFYINEEPREVREGDTIYIYENDRHYIRNDTSREFRFIEYFVPGIYKTVWAEGAEICTWNPSNKNIKGGQPSRHIAGHSSAEAHTRADI